MSALLHDTRLAGAYSIAEWDAMERARDRKYEWWDGRLLDWHDMAGANLPHNRIVRNLLTAADRRLLDVDGPCEVFLSDLAVYIPLASRYRYPDASILCGAPQHDPRQPRALTNPSVLVEATSATSEATDRVVTPTEYRHIPSLRYYVIISQYFACVEVHHLSGDPGAFSVRVSDGLDAVAELPELGLGLPLGEVYRGVDLDAQAEAYRTEVLGEFDGDDGGDGAPVASTG